MYLVVFGAVLAVLSMAVHGGDAKSRHTGRFADYGGKTCNSCRYLPLRGVQKLPCKSAIVAMAGQFDNSVRMHIKLGLFHIRSTKTACLLIILSSSICHDDCIFICVNSNIVKLLLKIYVDCSNFW